jgi:DNA (cytosine-5)-methyltransferase 1
VLKTLSLFSGIGGFELAMQAIGGFQVLDLVEKNPYRQKVLKQHFSSSTIHDDVKTFKPNKSYDLIVLGFPCKGMSVAGKGEGYDNKHSALWWDAYRIILESKPKFIIIENVRGFIDRGLRECIAALAVAGYKVDVPQIISAKEVGACHQRERVFVVAYTNSPEWGGEPTCWSRQIGEQIKAARGEVDLPAYASSIRQSAQSQSDCLSGSQRLETETEGLEQARTRTQSGRLLISCGEGDPRRLQFHSYLSGVVDGIPSWLDGYYQSGWWANNPSSGVVAAPHRSISDRQARISALGDSVTPQQAAVPLLRVKYLANFFRANVF